MNPMNTILRPVQDAADFDFIREFVGSAHTAGEGWALSWSPAVLQSELDEAECWIGAEFSSGQKLGFICVRPPGPAWDITLIGVAPAFRGKNHLEGLIKGLSERIRQDRRAAYSTFIDLEVRADNAPAIRAYEKCGFSRMGVRPRYYRDGEDAILYRRFAF